MPTLVNDLACPRCRASLDLDHGRATCARCGGVYEQRPYWDFAPSLHYADDETAPSEVEEAGERARAERFYLPLLQRLATNAGRPVTELSVLDDGCGFGAAVERLREAGVDAVGIDVGWRAAEWERRSPAWPFLRADGRSLPFADGTFDAVVSFGVIEHVGIEGETGASEQVASDYREHRARYVSEAVRVLRRPGLVVLSQPNGSCPVDFWHYAGSVPARLHSPRQPFLPRFNELRRWALEAAPDAHVQAVSPYDLLAFERIGGWWYGRAFAGVVRTLFRLMRVRPLAPLARSPLNPFLVVLIWLPR